MTYLAHIKRSSGVSLGKIGMSNWVLCIMLKECQTEILLWNLLWDLILWWGSHLQLYDPFLLKLNCLGFPQGNPKIQDWVFPPIGIAHTLWEPALRATYDDQFWCEPLSLWPRRSRRPHRAVTSYKLLRRRPTVELASHMCKVQQKCALSPCVTLTLILTH